MIKQLPWSAWAQAYHSRPLRERALIALALLALVYLLAEASLGRWLNGERAEIEADAVQIQLERQRLNTELQIFSAQELDKNNRQQRQLIELLAGQLQRLDQQLGPLQNQVQGPGQLMQMLRALAAKAKAVQLLGVKILPREVGEVDFRSSRGRPSGGIELEKHRLQLRLRGDYLALANFIRELEGSGWPIYWESLKYRLEHYPKAQLQLQIYTLRAESAALLSASVDTGGAQP